MICINGKQYDFEEKNLAEFLSEEQYRIETIAVERNEEIVPKSQYADTILHSGDVVEIVSFVGGG